jgi:hypothetical protein
MRRISRLPGGQREEGNELRSAEDLMDCQEDSEEFHIASWAMIRDHCGISKTARRAAEASKTARRAAEAY